MRVAVDELCALAMADADDSAVLSMTIESRSEGVAISGRCGPVTADPEIDPIAAQLLASGATSHSLSRDGDDCRFELQVDRPTTEGPAPDAS